MSASSLGQIWFTNWLNCSRGVRGTPSELKKVVSRLLTHHCFFSDESVGAVGEATALTVVEAAAARLVGAAAVVEAVWVLSTEDQVLEDVPVWAMVIGSYMLRTASTL